MDDHLTGLRPQLWTTHGAAMFPKTNMIELADAGFARFYSGKFLMR
ncbi:hypothetical protein [Paenibacillus ferrarius]